MCLYINKRFGPLEKPIKVWKIGYNNHVGSLITPFVRAYIPFNKKYKDPLYYGNKTYINFTSIDRGYIHAYVDKCLAIDTAKSLDCNVFEAIIPKGSVGFYGINGDICSDQILVMNDEFKKLYEELCV